MLSNTLKIAMRNMKKQKGYSLINVGGLAFGMAVFILIILFVRNELSFNRFHLKGDRIYRIVTA